MSLLYSHQFAANANTFNAQRTPHNALYSRSLRPRPMHKRSLSRIVVSSAVFRLSCALSLFIARSLCLLVVLIYRLMCTQPYPYRVHTVSYLASYVPTKIVCIFASIICSFVKFSVVAVNFLCENVLSWCRVKITFIFH